MPILHLTDEEVRTWSLEKKDRWWLEKVYKGNMPQLTLRSALTGMFLGGTLSLTNLYVGIKTGWTLGVGITSVILSFAAFKIISKLRIGSEITLLENNCTQSIATAAGYMTGPLIASLGAYMLVTNQVVPMWHAIHWMIAASVLGVLFAFPLKRRFINDEQYPFPEGRACGIVLDALHDEKGAEGVFKAKLLGFSAAFAAVFEVLRDSTIMQAMKVPFLAIPEYWDDFIYKFWTPVIMGTPLKDLTVRFETSFVMVAAGGLMGIRTGVSLLFGAVLNYCILAPIMIQKGIIVGSGFKNITMWALWGGVAMMTTSSLFSFFIKWRMLWDAMTGFMRKNVAKSDVLNHIELPMWVFCVGIPIVGGVLVWLTHIYFGVEIWMGIVAIPLVFVFTLIAATSTGLTSITPIGALGKLTQLTYSVLAPGNITTNLMTAGINAEVSSNASNLLMDIKPGYMLGAKPRQQAIGHVLGILAGAFVAVPVFYVMFNGDLTLFTSEKMPMPSVQVWKAVAEVLTKGWTFLHPTARWAILVGGSLGLILEIWNKKVKNKLPLNPVGIGLAFVIPFINSLSMALGAIFFWACSKKFTEKNSKGYKIFVENLETVCAGGIAGGALIGITLILIETLFLG